MCRCSDGNGSLEQDIGFLVHFHGVGNTAPFLLLADQFLTDTLSVTY